MGELLKAIGFLFLALIQLAFAGASLVAAVIIIIVAVATGLLAGGALLVLVAVCAFLYTCVMMAL